MYLNNFKKKVWVIIIITGFLLLSGCSNNTTKSPEQPIDTNRIVCFGNSLTEGYVGEYPVDKTNSYPHHLQQYVNIPVINLGYTGATTYDALGKIAEVLKYDPTILIIEFGANDLIHELENIENLDFGFFVRVQQNLEILFENFLHNERKVYLVKFYNYQIFADLLAFFELDESLIFIYSLYEMIFQNLEEKYEIEVITTIWDGVWGQLEFMSDIVHPNAEGYRIMAWNYLNWMYEYLIEKDLLIIDLPA